MSVSATPALTITLYTKPGCHLCDDLLRELHGIQDEVSLQIVERNIEEDAAEYDRYRYLVPVLELPGGQQLLPPHDMDTVRQFILAAARSVESRP